MKLLSILLLPTILLASDTPRKKYTKEELYAIKDKIDKEASSKATVKRKKLVKYKGPYNSPAPVQPRYLPPFPEIVIEFVKEDK